MEKFKNCMYKMSSLFLFFSSIESNRRSSKRMFLSRYEIHALLIRLLVYNSYPVRKTFIHQISKKFNPWIIYTIFLPLSNVLYIYFSLFFLQKREKKLSHFITVLIMLITTSPRLISYYIWHFGKWNAEQY